MVYDANDEAARTRALDDEKDRALDLGLILRDERGRRFMFTHIFETCHVRRVSFVSTDTHATAFNEGARAVGEALLEDIRSNHFDAFIKMMEEFNDPND